MTSSEFLKYSRKIRYIMFFLTLMMMIFSIREYMNHYEMEQSIVETEQERHQIEEETNFMQKFQLNYLESEYWERFMAYERNITLEDEYIIEFEFEEEEVQDEETDEQLSDLERQEQISRLGTPQESWQFFMEDKLSDVEIIRRLNLIN